MPARCSNNTQYRLCTRLQTRSQRSLLDLTNVGPEKDRPGNAHESTKKQFKGVKEDSSEYMTAIPDPLPEYNSLHKVVKVSSSSHSITTTSTSSTAFLTSSASVLQTATFRPLPPLLSMPPRTGLVYTTTMSALPSATSSDPPKTSSGQAVKLSGSRHLSVPIIVVSAVSSIIFLLAFLFAIKSCLRPRRRIHPTPSRPILEDTVDDSQVKMDNSPLFGCDGRQSLPGSSGLWTWTQYLQPPAKPAPTSGQDDLVESKGSDDENFAEALTYDYPAPTNKMMYPAAVHGNGLAITPANSFQQVSDVLTRISSRLSTASMSLYANHIAKDSQAVKVTPLTADGHPAIDRSSLSAQRSADEATRANRKENKVFRSSQGLAYDGADILSPQVCLPSDIASLSPLPAASGGRSRIKSAYYAAGGYPRISAAPPHSVTPSTRINNSGTKSPAPFLPQKSASRRVRDTRALTTALGVYSPEVSPLPSPQPTLYPDDSLSVIGDTPTQSQPMHRNGNGRERTQGEKVPNVFRNSQGYGPGVLHSRGDTNTALGKFMLKDYSSKSLVSIPGADFTSPSSVPVPPLPMASSMKRNYLTGDKPPRVPSPPPLPSLAQMALAHENPESFANYRSPTYSIYGLYEGERKSKEGPSH